MTSFKKKVKVKGGYLDSFSYWVKSGSPWVWINAAAVSASVMLVVGLLLLIAFRGLGHFWPSEVIELTYIEDNGQPHVISGKWRESEEVSAQRLSEAGQDIPDGIETLERILFKTANRDVTRQDFRWILSHRIREQDTPPEMVVLERTEWGDFIGRVEAVRQAGEPVDTDDAWAVFSERLERAGELRKQIKELERGEIGSINYQFERLRLERRELELDGVTDPEAYSEIGRQEQQLHDEYRELEARLGELYQDIRRDSVLMRTSDGEEVEIYLANIVDAWRPNDMNLAQQLGHYAHKAWMFVSDDPREANTEGGIFPAIFGTVLMVLLMTVVVAPFGVVAGVYLREYARQGLLTRTIRIADNNLAGVPSIVYGVFGLGFFVYTLGGSIDKLFFEAALPSPTFGTGGLFWASLTLALLTLPVVIVSTEEGLSRIPRSIREGSLALGATKFETLWRTIIPMASPGIMTGLILAVARAAGEVAPLMLVGVVKLAPSLPLDGNYPFLHPERKFMHLGFHIYDVGFQSPNVEAARPLVYATALLLVIVIVLLNMLAIHIRNGLREKYKGLES